MPRDREIIATPVPLPASIKFEKMKIIVEQNAKSWVDCLKRGGQTEIRRVMKDVAKDEKAAAKGIRSHRLTRDPRRDRGHLALTWDDYEPWVQQVLRAGGSIL